MRRITAVVAPGRLARGEPSLRRVAAFVLVAVLAQAWAALAPGLEFRGDYFASLAVLSVVAGGAVLVPWPRLPGWTQVLIPLGLVSWAGLLVTSQRNLGEGLNALGLLPILWVALYGREWEAAVVLLGAVTGLTVASAVRDDAASVIARRAVLFGLIGALLLAATQGLRRRLLAAIETRDEALLQARLLADAGRALNATLDPREVLATACHVGTEIDARGGPAPWRAGFIRTIDGNAFVVSQFDAAGFTVSDAWPVSEHPLLEAAIRSGQPAAGSIVPERLGPTARRLACEARVTHAVFLPVHVDGELYGVLELASRREPVSPAQLSTCGALVDLVELALGNALAHQSTERAALSDSLTGAANRRGLNQLVRERRGRRPIAALMVDVDNLKTVNDRHGHAAGDELIVQVAAAIRGVVRDGDVVARVGGDEFVAITFDADEASARAVAERILDATAAEGPDRTGPRVSIGIARGRASDGLEVVLGRADAALYEAKRSGGKRYVLAV